MLAIGSAAGSCSYPECHGVGGIGCDGCDSSEQQRWERDEAASAGDCVHRAAERAGEKKKQDGLDIQVSGLPHTGCDAVRCRVAIFPQQITLGNFRRLTIRVIAMRLDPFSFVFCLCVFLWRLLWTK